MGKISIKVLKRIDQNEACLKLKDNPQNLIIDSITSIKQTTFNPEKFYFYVNFLMEDGSKFSVNYTLDMVSYDEFECTTYSNYLYLLKIF